MPKVKGKKAEAARKREAAKCGQNPYPCVKKMTVADDPDYMPSELSESEEERLSPRLGPPEIESRNAESYPIISTSLSRTTQWRNHYQKTKKACTAAKQTRIDGFFKIKANTIVAFENQLNQVPETTSAAAVLPMHVNQNDTVEVIEVVSELPTIATQHAHVSTDPALSDRNEGIMDLTTDSPNIIAHDACLAIDQTEAIDQVSNPSSIVCDRGLGAGTTNSDSDHDSGSDSTASGTGHGKPAYDFYVTVQRHIKRIQKRLKTVDSLRSNHSAAAQLVDLNAFEQYNELRWKHHLEIQRLKRLATESNRQLRHGIRRRLQKIRPAIDASRTISQQFGRGEYFARIIRSSTRHILNLGELPPQTQGKGAHHETLLSNPEIYTALQTFVKGVLPVDQGGFNGNLHAHHLSRYVNNFLLPKLDIDRSICKSTAEHWLRKLGFSMSRVQKGIYIDGHERDDVVKSRNEFIEFMYHDIIPFSYSYEEPPGSDKSLDLTENPPALAPGEKIHYPIFHDETCIHANDLTNFVWKREGEQPLRKKGRGRVIHISDFIIEHSGRLVLTPEEITEQMKLPEQPLPQHTLDNDLLRQQMQKAQKAKNRSGKGRTLTEYQNEWIPPLPPSPYRSYRLRSFDARRIIYPGINHDGWWDMPQLIAQVILRCRK